MKLKDLVSISKNSANKQVNLNLKKRKLKFLDITEEQILNMKINLGKLNI